MDTLIVQLIAALLFALLGAILVKTSKGHAFPSFLSWIVFLFSSAGAVVAAIRLLKALN